MYVFSGWNNLKDILNAIDEPGFITVNHLIWKYQFRVVTILTLRYYRFFVRKKDEKRKLFLKNYAI